MTKLWTSAKANTGVKLLDEDSGKQIRMSRDGARLLFRKSDKVLLEFKTNSEEIIPTRGIRLEDGNIADFCYSIDGKFIYLITDDGILHFRSKSLDKDYVIDRSKLRLKQRASTSVCLFLWMESTLYAAPI